MENQSRRQNLVFYNLPREKENEKWEDCEVLVQQIIQKLLKIDTTVLIDRAHRAGTTIVVRFTNYKDKACVLRNAYKLRGLGSNVGISEDFSKTVREKRKGLMDLRKDYRARGVKTNLVLTN